MKTYHFYDARSRCADCVLSRRKGAAAFAAGTHQHTGTGRAHRHAHARRAGAVSHRRGAFHGAHDTCHPHEGQRHVHVRRAVGDGYARRLENARFGGLATPADYETKKASVGITKGEGMEDVTVILPRNEVVADLWIEVPDEAQVAAPTPYANGPVLYYGSSITEGGCACNAFNAYNMLISRHLDLDFYNFGFSNSAKGELAMADYINTVPVKAFIMDYDHNAPSAQHLWNTHEAFFRRIREKQPTLPVLFLTMPAAEYSEGKKARRAAVRATYDHAVAAGDKHVWFIDGETLLAGADAWLCTVDNTHPNDLGFHRMAAVIEPVVREMLGI